MLFRSSWALPIFHIAMDSILVALMVIAASSEPELQRMIRAGQTVMDTPPCSPCRLLAASAPPASILASRFSRRASEEIGWSRTGWLWLGLFEAIAIPFWFLLGWISDRGQAAVLRWCLALVAIRVVAIALVGSRYRAWVQVFFWAGVVIYSVVAGIYRLAQLTRSRRD